MEACIGSSGDSRSSGPAPPGGKLDPGFAFLSQASRSARVNAANPSLPLEVSTDWYRLPTVKAAFVLSLLVHAAVILLLPGLRVPVPAEPPALVVELAPLPEPVVTPPPPVPEPKPVAAPRPPPVKEKPPEPPPVITRVVPQPEAPPEARVPPPPEPKPEPRPEPKPQPVPEPRVEAPPPPPVVQPRPEPPPAVAEPAPKALPPAPVAPALSTPDPGLLKAYGSALAQAIGQRKSYPRLARMRNWQGTTELKLQFGVDAKLKGISVAHSSGFELLDEQAVTMVKETVPFPELPAALRGREFVIAVPVVFKLQ
jgi:periplasmic protein TonB